MTQSRRPSPLQRRVLIVLAALDEKRPGPVLTRDVNATIFNRYLPFSCPLRYFRY